MDRTARLASLLAPVLLLIATAHAAPPQCPPGTRLAGAPPPEGDGHHCLDQQGRQHGPAVGYHDSGAVSQRGRYERGERVGWWARWDADGSALGSTLYVGGEAVQGAGAGQMQSRCLERPPPPGVYDLREGDDLCADAPQLCGAGSPVHTRIWLVDGCLGYTETEESWRRPGGLSASVTGPDRWELTWTNGYRCPSGWTLRYRYTESGALMMQPATWSYCGDRRREDHAERTLVRPAALRVRLSTTRLQALATTGPIGQRLAAVERLLQLQDDPQACAPLGQVIGAGPVVIAQRALWLARAVCLASAATGRLGGDLSSLAATALVRVSSRQPEPLLRAIPAVVRSGQQSAARALARGLRRAGWTATPGLRAQLVAEIRRGDAGQRDRARVLLEQLYPGEADGLELFAIASGAELSCEARRELLVAAPVRNWVPRSVPDAELAAALRPLLRPERCEKVRFLVVGRLGDHLTRDGGSESTWALYFDVLQSDTSDRVRGEGRYRFRAEAACESPAPSPEGSPPSRLRVMALLRARWCDAP